MALEIRELVIRATVSSKIGETNTSSVSQANLDALKAQIIEICMEKTKALLEDRIKR